MDGSSGDVAVSIHVGNLLDGAGLWPDLVAYPPPREVPKGLVSHLAGAGPDEDQACLSIQAGLYLKEVFETRADEGAEGSGDDWAALVRVLVAERMPELADTIDLDPDAQELFIYSDDAKSLKRLQSALASLGDHLADTTQLFARANLE